MAKMTETQALEILVSAASLASQLAVLVPTLIQNLQNVREGLDTTDADLLNDKIKVAHADIQSLDGKLAALQDA